MKGKREAKKSRPKETIGSIAAAAIQAGKSNEQVLALVKKVHPGGRTTLQSISWYRSKVSPKKKDAAKRRKAS